MPSRGRLRCTSRICSCLFSLPAAAGATAAKSTATKPAAASEAAASEAARATTEVAVGAAGAALVGQQDEGEEGPEAVVAPGIAPHQGHDHDQGQAKDQKEHHQDGEKAARADFLAWRISSNSPLASGAST